MITAPRRFWLRRTGIGVLVLFGLLAFAELGVGDGCLAEGVAANRAN